MVLEIVIVRSVSSRHVSFQWKFGVHSTVLNSTLDRLPNSENRIKKFLSVQKLEGGVASTPPLDSNVTKIRWTVEG